MNMIIGGKGVASVTGQSMEIRNPATGEVIDRVPKAGVGDVELAIESALRGREIMRNLPTHRRSSILCKASNLIGEHHEELSQLLCRENGKPISQARGEIEGVQRLFLAFSEEAKRLNGESFQMDAIPGFEHVIAYTIRQPLGVIVGIVPFNYPVDLFSQKAAPALAAGNSVIVKVPEQCPLAVLRVGELLIEAGLPPEALQILTGRSSEMGNLLVTHTEVAMISFTGGTTAARTIAKLAADSLKRTAFELGGVDAMIVLEDAVLEKAAAAVVQGRLTNAAGQICCAVKRVLVAEKVYKPFVEVLLKQVAAIKMGDPLQENTELGPLITEQAAEGVHSAVLRSIEAGAKCLTGGKRVGHNFYEPTVLVNVSDEMPCMHDEIFGPVVPIASFKNVKDAIATVNSIPYGLQACVFSENIHNALGVAHRFEVGGVVVNGPAAFRPGNLPFGGVKLSGYGSESFSHTIREMSHEVAIALIQNPLA